MQIPLCVERFNNTFATTATKGAAMNAEARATDLDSIQMPQRTARNSVECRHCSLYEICCLAGLHDAMSTRIDDIVARREPVRAGASIILQDSTAESLFAVKSGALKSYATLSDGSRQIVDFHFPGELIGIDTLSSGHHRHTVEALTDSSVCRLRLSRIPLMAQHIQEFQHHMIRALSQRMRQEYWVPLMMGAQSAEQRAATFLLSIFNRLSQRALPAVQFKLPMSRQEIANYLGLAVETVSRMFQRMQQLNVMEVRGRHVKLCDIHMLRRLARLDTALAM